MAIRGVDRLVFFGATGDLAHDEVFPALGSDRLIELAGGWHQPQPAP